MDEFDKNELLAAMYNDDGDTPVTTTSKEPASISGFSRTRKIKVGIIEYEVPTVEYVNRLEQMINQQALLLDQQKQQIERLKGFVTSTRSFIRRQTNRLVEIQTDLDGKLDYREYP